MAKYHICRAGNIKRGTTKSGNPYYSVGCVIKKGPDEGKWRNYFLVVTEKTRERVERDLATMGITNPDPSSFETDGRLFTAVEDYDDYFQKDTIRSVKNLMNGNIEEPHTDDSDVF